MNQKRSTSNQKKKTRISKTLIISEHPFGKKEKLKEKITKLNKELENRSRYNTLNINDTSKQDNEQNELLNDFEIDKIKPKNLSKFKFNNNSTIVLDAKKYTKLRDKNKNNITYNRSNINNAQLINGGNHKNHNEKINLKIAFNNRNPIKLRKINTNIKKNYLLEDNNPLIDDKNLETINTLSTINLRENKISKSKKDEETINKLKEEIEKLKEENANDDIILNGLKNQLNENKDDVISEDSDDTDTNEEINIDQNFINSIEENNIFNKLRANYMYNKILINQLTNQNSELKIKIINKSNNIIRRGNSDENEFNNIYKIQKECTLNIFHNDNNKINNPYDPKNTALNGLIEKKLKSNQRDSFMMKRLNEDTNDKIKIMLKMIINANNINKDEIINLFMNNLMDYYKAVETFASKYLNITNSPDIKILKNYFKSIFFDSEKKFNINNAFNEILSFYDDEIKKLEEINILEIYNNHKTLIENIMKRCKIKDFLDTGLIEFTVFQNIYNEFHDKKEFIQTDREKILNAMIYNMKKNKNESNEQIGLFFLSYQNLCNVFNLNDILNHKDENEKSSETKSKRKKNKFK